MNILVTRPDERGSALVEALTEQGFFALHQPLFSVEKGRELSQLPSLLARLNSGDYLFAVSRNAVDFAVNALKETGFSWRSDLHYFAVGQGTANYFCSQIEQSVHYPIQSENSEGLLALPEMQALQGKNIVILRADSGRAFFGEQAEQRGAKVQAVECYQRLIADNLAEQLSLAKRTGIDTIIITSGEILHTLVEQTAEAEQGWLRACRLIVVGQRIANIARRLGWNNEQILISERADNQHLLEFCCNTKS